MTTPPSLHSDQPPTEPTGQCVVALPSGDVRVDSEADAEKVFALVRENSDLRARVEVLERTIVRMAVETPRSTHSMAAEVAERLRVRR